MQWIRDRRVPPDLATQKTRNRVPGLRSSGRTHRRSALEGRPPCPNVGLAGSRRSIPTIRRTPSLAQKKNAHDRPIGSAVHPSATRASRAALRRARRFALRSRGVISMASRISFLTTSHVASVVGARGSKDERRHRFMPSTVAHGQESSANVLRRDCMRWRVSVAVANAPRSPTISRKKRFPHSAFRSRGWSFDPAHGFCAGRRRESSRIARAGA